MRRDGGFRGRCRVAGALALLLGLLSGCAGEARSAASEPSVARACDGLPAVVADGAIAELRGSVAGVAPLIDGRAAKAMPHLVGAAVEVHAIPGMTAQWLGRVLRCDAARRPTADCSAQDCPLVPAGGSADVTPTEAGFTVAVRSSDRDVANEIEHRARLFARPVRPVPPVLPSAAAASAP